MGSRRLIASAIVLAGSLAGCTPALPARSALDAGGVEALIKRQSQEFSDASATGDAAALDRYLDERVVFMNETGALASKKDIVSSAVPAEKGVANSLTQTDWVLEMHGQVAVTSFTDVSTQQFHGQTLHAKYRSTEVWLQEGGSWRMISSQTIALEDDPPAVTLPTTVLDEYVGTYAAGPDFTYKIARDAAGLTGAVGEGKPTAMKAELVDVLFTPGQPRMRKIFQRDASGKVTGFVFRSEGHDIALKRVS